MQLVLKANLSLSPIIVHIPRYILHVVRSGTDHGLQVV